MLTKLKTCLVSTSAHPRIFQWFPSVWVFPGTARRGPDCCDQAETPRRPSVAMSVGSTLYTRITLGGVLRPLALARSKGEGAVQGCYAKTLTERGREFLPAICYPFAG
jgi:hypothetical protein